MPKRDAVERQPEEQVTLYLRIPEQLKREIHNYAQRTRRSDTAGAIVLLEAGLAAEGKRAAR